MLRHIGGKSMFFFNTISFVCSLLSEPAAKEERRNVHEARVSLSAGRFRPITADSVRPNKAPPYLIERNEAVAQG